MAAEASSCSDMQLWVKIRNLMCMFATSTAIHHRVSISQKTGPILDDFDGPSKTPCLYYNTWRYGFEQFRGTLNGVKSPQEYFKQYVTRDVVSLVGYQGVKNSGDNSCMAKAQGGSKRCDRNLVWYRYIHKLARTSEDLTGLPGRFNDIPDWSSISNRMVKLRLSVAGDATHDAAEVLQSGLSALFSDGDIEVGWRPGAAT